jgi:hypothetical protein
MWWAGQRQDLDTSLLRGEIKILISCDFLSYPTLYNIVRYKNDTIAKIMKISAPNMTFRRDLSG